MSEKRTREFERRQRFRRLRHQLPYQQGVSPVVATLILILIAVAAAAALYLWLVGWQGSVTGSISKPGVQQGSFSIGGSTSVYPFDELAVTQYQQNYTGVTISDTEGGTGAGMLAVCAGAIDVGTASTPETAEGLIASDGCPASDASTITVTTVAYDAVDVVVDSAAGAGGAHGLLSINYDTLNDIYEAASTSAPLAYIGTMNGATVTAGASGDIVFYGHPLDWDQIPAMVQGAVTPTTGSAACGGTALTEALADGIGVEGGTGQAAGTGACVNDIVTPTTDPSPCGWTVCAGPYAATPTAGEGPEAAIVPVERSDASGTTQTFEAKLLGYGTSSGGTSATTWVSAFSSLGYNGCGTNNLLTDCGITVATQGNGNPGVLSDVAGNPNAIGYASDGLARTTADIGTNGIIAFDATGQAPGGSAAPPQTSGANIAYGAVVPTTGSTGTIAGGITASTSINNYAGWRPFEYVTLTPLSDNPTVSSYVAWVLQPGVNTNLATESDEVSVYSI